MDLDNIDIGLEELDIKSVDINPAANINRTGSPSISLSTGVNPGIGASSQSAFAKPPSLSISNNSLDGGSLDFGLDLLANKKKVRPNDAPSGGNGGSGGSGGSGAQPRAQSPSKPISISFAEKPAAPSMSGPSTDFTTIDLEKELASMNLDDVPKMSGPGVPDFSSAAPSYSFDSTPSVSIPQAPQLSYEQIQSQKFDYLCKLERLQKNGAKTSRIFSMSSDLEEIRMEYEKIMYERRLQNSIKIGRAHV